MLTASYAHYRVDFDIAGTANSLLKTTTKQEQVVHPWLEDDWGQEVIQQRITREYIDSEDDAMLKYPPNFQGGYAIVNREAPNAWGYPRGYAIHPGYNPIHNVCRARAESLAVKESNADPQLL